VRTNRRDAEARRRKSGESLSASGQEAEAGAEVAEEGGLRDDFESAERVFARVHFENCLNNVINVALSVDPARDRETEELVARLISEHEGTDLDGTDSGVPI
jgi:hypothetical protein